MASGHPRAPRQQAEQMAAPTSAASPSENPLPTGSRPQMAISRSPGQVAGATALPPATDIRAPKSAFALTSSAVPPGADAQDVGAIGPEVTHSGPWGHSGKGSGRFSGSPAVRRSSIQRSKASRSFHAAASISSNVISRSVSMNFDITSRASSIRPRPGPCAA